MYRRWWHYVLGTNTYRDTGYTRENPFPKPVIPPSISYMLLFLRLVATMVEVILIANMFITQQFAGRQSQIFIVMALAVIQIGFGFLHTWKMRQYELTAVNLLVMFIAVIVLFAMPNLP
jgi:heme/copper-type cytochrome/quinol oxidase subunit 4